MNPSSFSNFDTLSKMSIPSFASTLHGESHELNLMNENKEEWIVDLFPTLNDIFCPTEKSEFEELDKQASFLNSSPILPVEEQLYSKKVSTLPSKSYYYETRTQKNYYILSIVNSLKLGKSKLWSQKNAHLLVQTRLEYPNLTWEKTAKKLNKISLTKFSPQSCRSKWLIILKSNPQLSKIVKKKDESTSVPLLNIATRSSNVKN